MLEYKTAAYTQQIINVKVNANVDMIFGLCDRLLNPF